MRRLLRPWPRASRDLPGGFVWRAHRFTQLIQARPTESGAATPRGSVLVAIRTPLLRDVTASPLRVLEALRRANVESVGSAWVYDGKRRAVDLLAQGRVPPEAVAERCEELAAFAVLQLCEAERAGEQFAEKVGGATELDDTPWVEEMPGPHPALDAPAEHFLPYGLAPVGYGAWRELERVRHAAQCLGVTATRTLDGGMRLAVPVEGDHTLYITLDATTPNPWLGLGLQVELLLPPLHAGRATALRLAAAMQRAQLAGGAEGDALGAWTAVEREHEWRVAWRRFVPGALYVPGQAMGVAIDEIERAHWVVERHRRASMRGATGTGGGGRRAREWRAAAPTRRP